MGWVTKLRDTHIRAKGTKEALQPGRKVIVLPSIGSLGRPCRNLPESDVKLTEKSPERKKYIYKYIVWSFVSFLRKWPYCIFM